MRAAFVSALIGVAFLGALFAPGRDHHDLQIYIDAGQRIINHGPVYGISDGGPNWFVGNQDLVGPPFQGLAFAPLGAIAGRSFFAATYGWDLFNLAAFCVGLWAWSRALEAALPTSRPIWRSTAMLVALVVVAVPIYSNFRLQNTTDLMFCVLGLSALALTRGRDVSAGVLVGLAAAFKAYPALIILYFLYRRRWAAAFAASLAAVVATLLVAVPVGWSGFVEAVHAFRAHSQPQFWPQWSQNQALPALVQRLLPPGVVPIVQVAISGALLLLGAQATYRSRPNRVAADLALVVMLAVLISPIAWNHYWILMIPGATIAWAAQGDRQTLRRALVIIAGVLISVISRVTVGEAGAEAARYWSQCSIAGLLLTVAVASALSERDSSQTSL